MLQREKLDQAKRILQHSDVDLWLTLVRETGQTSDPVLPLLCPVDFTWTSAIMVTKTGRSIALVGNHDAEGVRQTALFDEVRAYEQDFKPDFAALLAELQPQRMALNYSLDNPAADGLTHGMYLYLQNLLAELSYTGDIVSAADIIRPLRGQKTASELTRIQRSIDTAERIFDEASAYIRVGVSELDIFHFFNNRLVKYQASPAWLPAQCPGVMVGPRSIPGHNAPAQIEVCPGDVMTIDFGVSQDDYCSDLQRVYYAHHEADESEDQPPQEVLRAFSVVREAVQRAAQAMRPGTTGFAVDEVARQYVTSHGYPEWKYALGHEVGRKAHDGGTVLGPRWERYKGAIDVPLLVGNVFTLELGVPIARGYVGLEEMVLITDHGAVFLSHPQSQVYMV